MKRKEMNQIFDCHVALVMLVCMWSALVMFFFVCGGIICLHFLDF